MFLTLYDALTVFDPTNATPKSADNTVELLESVIARLVLEDQVGEIPVGQAARVAVGHQTLPGVFAAAREAGEDLLAGPRILRAVVDLLQRGHLRWCEALVGLAARAGERRRIERAGPWIRDHAVRQAVSLVAGGQRGGVDRRQLRRRDRCARRTQRLGVPDEAGIRVRLEVPWRADDEAVEVLGIVLCLEQSLASAVRTRAEIRVARRPAVERRDCPLGGDRDEMLGAIQVVGRAVLVAEGTKKEGAKADPLKEAALAAKLPVYQPASYRGSYRRSRT